MSCSVASVTVAYNDERVLPRQLEALLHQTRPLQEVIVVDNASTDSTRTLLAERFPQVTVLPMGENRGAGGALAAAMAYAVVEKHHDWVWTFDADSVPEASTLAVLLEGITGGNGRLGRVGMASPLLVHRKTGEFYLPLFWRDGFVKPDQESLREPLILVDLLAGSGTLVRRDVVETIGVPRADMFMYFLDFEYCLRARARGYEVAVVTRARLAHEIGNAREIHLPGFPRLWAHHAPWQEYYMSRNLAYATWHLYPTAKAKLFCLRHLSRHAVGVALFSQQKLACLTKMAQGFWDGRSGKLGVRFRP